MALRRARSRQRRLRCPTRRAPERGAPRLDPGEPDRPLHRIRCPDHQRRRLSVSRRRVFRSSTPARSSTWSIERSAPTRISRTATSTETATSTWCSPPPATTISTSCSASKQPGRLQPVSRRYGERGQVRHVGRLRWQRHHGHLVHRGSRRSPATARLVRHARPAAPTGLRRAVHRHPRRVSDRLSGQRRYLGLADDLLVLEPRSAGQTGSECRSSTAARSARCCRTSIRVPRAFGIPPCSAAR